MLVKTELRIVLWSYVRICTYAYDTYSLSRSAQCIRCMWVNCQTLQQHEGPAPDAPSVTGTDELAKYLSGQSRTRSRLPQGLQQTQGTLCCEAVVRRLRAGPGLQHDHFPDGERVAACLDPPERPTAAACWRCIDKHGCTKRQEVAFDDHELHDATEIVRIWQIACG